jgi:hypothetical protein
LSSFSPGESQFITAPVPARLDFGIGLNYRDEEEDVKGIEESERRLESMMAQQAAFKMDGSGLDDDEITSSTKLSDREKKDLLQKALNMAASNGEEERVRKLLKGEASKIIDVNAPDEEGTSPLIYASCFVRSHCTLGGYQLGLYFGI